MKIYNYDSLTGEYIGEGQADQSPLEPGVFLIPAFATETAPPAVGENAAPVFVGGAWQEIEDYRGATYWLLDGSEYVVENLGPLPEGAALVPPPAKVMADSIAAIQKHLDNFARTRNYDGILSAATYAASTVAKFRTEGQYAVEARDATWAKCYEILAAVEARSRPMPTLDELLAELPVLTWPQ